MRKSVAFFIIAILCSSYVLASHKFLLGAKGGSPQEILDNLRQDSSPLYLAIASYYFAEGDIESSIDHFRKAISLNPSALAYHNLAVAYYYSGDIESSIKSFLDAIDIDPSYAKAYYSLALAYYGQGDYDSAIAALSSYPKLREDPYASFDLGVIYADRFRYAEGPIDDLNKALGYFSDAESLQPGFPHAASNAEVIEGLLAVHP